MHFVLFSFKTYHEAIFKVDLWQRLKDETKTLYLEVLDLLMNKAGEVVANSWRYYMTYVRALGTIIDSN